MEGDGGLLDGDGAYAGEVGVGTDGLVPPEEPTHAEGAIQNRLLLQHSSAVENVVEDEAGFP